MAQSSEFGNEGLQSHWLIRLIWQFKWLILGFVGGIMLVAWIATQFMTPLYQSTATLYATNPQANANVFKYQEFGWDVDSDRHIQILKSSRVRDSIIQIFDLIDHYDIDTTEKQWKSKLYTKYQNRVNFDRTIYMTIEISVKDRDPEMAAQMVNEIIRLGDVVKADILKQNVHQALKSVEEQYREKQNEVDQLTKELVEMKSVSADEAVAKLQRKIERKSAKVQEIRNALNNIRARHQVHDLREQIDVMREHLTDAQSRYLLESGKLAVYKEILPESDTMRIKAKANMQGALKKKEELKEQLAKISKDDLMFNKLKNAISLHQELLNDFERRIQRIMAAYEPSAEHARLERKKKAFNAELNRLNHLKTKYEEALQEYEKPIPQAYVISEAEPIYKPVSPKPLFNLFVAAILGFLFITGLLAFLQRFKPF